MPESKLVAKHYTHGSLTAALLQGIQKLGKTVETIEIDDLAPVDEFHIGGRIATQNFLNQLEMDSSHHVLDVGCGLGGASRFAASTYGCRVTGVDLTEEYIETGNTMCSWVGLADRVHLEVGDATDLSHKTRAFDRAYLLHVGMNIADKRSLASELFRVIQPGGKIGIYDVMRVGDGDLAFPVPWASDAHGSAVGTKSDYHSALASAGFNVTGERDRRQFALDFFDHLQSIGSGTSEPPPLGLQILMGASAPQKIGNMIENISRKLVAPVEIIAEKPR